MEKSSNNFLNNKIILLIFLIVTSGFVYFIIPKQSNTPSYDIVWVKQLHQVGVGSPRLVDINSDDHLDIIIGSGFEWSKRGESAINAIDGKTGDIIWRHEIAQSVYGTPLLIDTNDDGVEDITVSGRFNDFLMVNGKNGEMIWSLSEENAGFNFLDCNFNSPTLIDDIDNDGVNDLVTIQGGLANGSENLKVFNNKTGEIIMKKYDKEVMMNSIKEFLKNNDDSDFEFKVCRYDYCEIKKISRNMLQNYSYNIVMTKIMPDQEGPGSLVYVISSKTGQILKQYEVPFGKESWSVPIYKKVNGKNLLIYGSGGERTGGHFLAQDIDNGEIIWSIENKNKGFISAPLLYRESGQDFVVTNSMEGDIRKVNAKTGKEIWKKSVGSDFESYSSVTVGRFNGKEYNDIVSIFSRGVWPTYESASIYVFDGKTGDIIFKEKIGYCQSSSSPVISDLDNDLKDDILYLSCTDRYARVTVLNNQLDVIMSHPVSSGAFSTPVVMDIDNNKRLDLIIPRFHFIDRYEMVEIMSNYESSWNQYRGKLWNGVYSK